MQVRVLSRAQGVINTKLRSQTFVFTLRHPCIYTYWVPLVNCKNCKVSFNKKPSQISRSVEHYCSLVCHHNARKTGVLVKCSECNKEIYKDRRALGRSMHKNFFCSTKCSNVLLGRKQFSENHPNWKTGEFSYKSIMKRITTNPKCVLCERVDMRILAVHHIDKDRKNNSLQNLVWLCYNCHFLVHHYQGENRRLIILRKNASS